MVRGLCSDLSEATSDCLSPKPQFPRPQSGDKAVESLGAPVRGRGESRLGAWASAELWAFVGSFYFLLHKIRNKKLGAKVNINLE